MTHNGSRIDWKFIVLLSGSVLLFWLAIYRSSRYSAAQGWPYLYYCQTGFKNGGRYNWMGVLGDGVLAFSLGAILWAFINGVSNKERLNASARLVRYQTWGWIRVFYGLSITLDVIETLQREMAGQLSPRFAPSNADQQSGVYIGYSLIFCVAAWLFYSGCLRIAAIEISPKRSSGPNAENIEGT